MAEIKNFTSTHFGFLRKQGRLLTPPKASLKPDQFASDQAVGAQDERHHVKLAEDQFRKSADFAKTRFVLLWKGDSAVRRRLAYCTITVRAVLWLRLPDLVVTVAVYVPAGVPGVVVGDDEPPPPHPGMARNATAINGMPRMRIRRR